jgi:hypothetical protein
MALAVYASVGFARHKSRPLTTDETATVEVGVLAGIADALTTVY